jgi:hypothetical protein
MDERNLYRELVAWLRSHHPLVLAHWESERKLRTSGQEGGARLLQPPKGRSRSGLDELTSDSSTASIVRALQLELESMGISGGTPGVTSDGTPCVHLLKKGVYGTTYEESVTLARIRDTGYRRHLKQVFG